MNPDRTVPMWMGALALILWVLVLGGTLLAIAGCGDDDARGNGDAPVDKAHVDNTPAKVFNFSNRYPNIERKVDTQYCNVIYVNQRDHGYFQVVHDPKCGQGSG